MKLTKYIRTTAVCALMATAPLVSCDTEELHNLNIDPQAVGEIDMNYLFTAAELGAASAGSAGDNRYIDWRTNIGFAAYAIQQLATASGGISPGDKYTDNVESYNAPWEFIYGDQLKNLAEVLKQTGPGGFAEGTKKNTREASRILRAFLFHRLTDYYGNIPYSQALQGIEEIYTPEYDHQQTIYTDLLKELDEASAAISASNPDDGFAAADLIYEGDIAKWKKFGYSLMLRLAMRVSNVDPTLAETYVTKAIQGGVFTSNDDNAWVPMALEPSEWTNQNGISRAFAAGDGGQPTTLSKRLVDMLKGADASTAADDDPRLMIISGGVDEDTDPLVQEGMPNGLDQALLDDYLGIEGANQSEHFSRINVLLLDDDDPYMLMNYAEVELLQAEAIERSIGTVPGTAKDHFEAGVAAAIQMYTPFDASLEVDDAVATAYAQSLGYTDGSGDALEMIGDQLWLSKFFNWWDAWADWRRTGFPILVPTDYPGNVTGGTIPRKLRLPSHEVAVNAENIAAGATLPDNPTTRVWWDGGN